jgi:hypothetical protein
MLKRLNRRRNNGSHFIRENDTGMVVAQLMVGKPADDVMQDAPWLEEWELEVLQDLAWWRPWGDIGELIALTFEEWKTEKRPFTRPVDVPVEVVEAELAERRKASSRRSTQKLRDKRRREAEETKRRHTEKQTATKDHERAAVILDEITYAHEHPGREFGGEERSVAELMKMVRTHPAFRGMKDLRYVVLRGLKQIEAAGLIATRVRPGKRGDVRVAKLIPIQAPIQVENTSNDRLKMSKGSRDGQDQVKPEVIQEDKAKMGGVTFALTISSTQEVGRTVSKSQTERRRRRRGLLHEVAKTATMRRWSRLPAVV